MVVQPRDKDNVQYKATDREDFFRRLDRGGTIRAVAAELGVSVDSCYRWRREEGVSAPRAKSRSYTAEDKAEFFRRLKLKGNVTFLCISPVGLSFGVASSIVFLS